MKIQVYETEDGMVTYKVSDKYYGFLGPAPQSQEEFEQALGSIARQALAEEKFFAYSFPEKLQLKFVCEVEA